MFTFLWTSVSPAIVYFPQGYVHPFKISSHFKPNKYSLRTYLISAPIIAYYYTQLIGDAKVPPTLLAAASFDGLAVIGMVSRFGTGCSPILTWNYFKMPIHTFQGAEAHNITRTLTTCEPRWKSFLSLPFWCLPYVKFPLDSKFRDRRPTVSFPFFHSQFYFEISQSECHRRSRKEQASIGKLLKPLPSWTLFSRCPRLRILRIKVCEFSFFKPHTLRFGLSKGIWMENGRWIVFNFLTLTALTVECSGGFMGDLVFNGGNKNFHRHILSKLSFFFTGKFGIWGGNQQFVIFINSFLAL